jgi:hypothetical protein
VVKLQGYDRMNPILDRKIYWFYLCISESKHTVLYILTVTSKQHFKQSLSSKKKTSLSILSFKIKAQLGLAQVYTGSVQLGPYKM